MTIFGTRSNMTEGLIQSVMYTGDSAKRSIGEALTLATALGIEAEQITLDLDSSQYPENKPNARVPTIVSGSGGS